MRATVIDGHFGGHRDRRHLRDFDGPLADDVAAEDLTRAAIDHELAESARAPVDDRPRRFRV